MVLGFQWEAMEAKGRIVKTMLMGNASISILGPSDALGRLVFGRSVLGAWTMAGLGKSRLCIVVMELWCWVVLDRVMLGFRVIVVFF